LVWNRWNKSGKWLNDFYEFQKQKQPEIGKTTGVGMQTSLFNQSEKIFSKITNNRWNNVHDSVNSATISLPGV